MNVILMEKTVMPPPPELKFATPEKCVFREKCDFLEILENIWNIFQNCFGLSVFIDKGMAYMFFKTN